MTTPTPTAPVMERPRAVRSRPYWSALREMVDAAAAAGIDARTAMADVGFFLDAAWPASRTGEGPVGAFWEAVDEERRRMP